MKKFTLLVMAMAIASFMHVLIAQQVAGNLATEKLTSVNIDEGSFYIFVNKATGKVMDVKDKSIILKENIIVADLDYTMHQVWRMEDKGDGYYNVKGAFTDMVARDNAPNVQQEREGNSGSHFWLPEPVSGTYFKLYNKNTKRYLSVDGDNIFTEASTSSDNQLWEIMKVSAEVVAPDFSLQGFASVGAGTTGGAGGATVTVNNAADLIHYMQRPEPYIILIQGTIELGAGNHHSPSDNMHSISPNKTLFGLEGATIKNGGFNIRGTRNNGVGTVTRSNIIIRNLIFQGPAPDDFINIEWGSSHVWVDHNTFIGPNFDGMVDVKRESSFITISWNKLLNNHKTMLCGHDDNHTFDEGYLFVTYHHNQIVNSQSRHPRIRYGRAHFYNNLLEDCKDYIVGAGIKSQVLSENNHVVNEIRTGTYYRWYHDTGRGFERGNGSLLNNIDKNHEVGIVTNDLDWVPEDYYSYTLNHALSLRYLLPKYAGAGVLSFYADDQEYHSLNVSVVGNGTASPLTGSYAEGAKVEITATAYAGWQFSSWSGDFVGTENPVSIDMNADKSIVANFVKVDDGEHGDNGSDTGTWEYAVTYDWNFSDMSQYASSFTVAGSQNIAGAILYDKIAVDAMAARDQEIDGVNFSYDRRVKLGGTGVFSSGNPSARVYAFEVSGDAKITIVAQSGSTSSGVRLLGVRTAEGVEVGTASAPPTTVGMSVIEYKGNATTIYLYSTDSGINLYHIRVEEPKPTDSTNYIIQNSSSAVASVKYYNISGISLGDNFNSLPSGIFIEVTTFTDGASNTKKILKQHR
jgi:pectate lyase